MTKHLLVLLMATAALVCSCRRGTEIGSTEAAARNWNPKDSLRYYFPQGEQVCCTLQYTRGDGFLENWYSSALFSLREPVLYDKHTEGSIYRFLWLRSFHRPMVFVLRKNDDRVTLTTKKLDRQPEFSETKYMSKGWDGLLESLKGKTIEQVGDSMIIVKADRKANIVYDSTIDLLPHQWDEFEELLNKTNFQLMASNLPNDGGMDGAEWVIEYLHGDHYHFVRRWSPENGIRYAGEYLIGLSGLKEEIY